VYARRWLSEPSRAALASITDITGHVENHIIPRLGAMRMIDVRPRHVRDFLRALKTDTELDLAPKTILNVFGTLRTMFNDAVVDELIMATPAVVKREDLPEKVDKDPEWREQATYERAEVIQLLTSPTVPPERRVQYALKALAGLRHGEVAGLRWHHWTVAGDPLGKLVVARTYKDKRTKTKVAKPVPVHPELARVLAAWRALWPEIYGDEPTPDDYVVPTRGRTPVDPSDAGIAFKLDLTALGLRVGAGEHRARGGHDLRAWFISTALEDGAAPDALYAVTHTKKRDVASGYNRQRWSRLCEAVSALQLPLGEDPLAVVPGFVTRELSLRRRWYKDGDPDGIRTRRNARKNAPETAQTPAATGPVAAPCDLMMRSLVTGACYQADVEKDPK
jgi:integrase